MGFSSNLVIVPEVNDARGLLIPDDIFRYQQYINLDPTTFWSSYQFYIKAGKTRDEVIDPATILKYLSAIPDPHFRLIRSICLDLGFNDAFDFLEDRDAEEYYERLIGCILARGNGELVVKLLSATTVHATHLGPKTEADDLDHQDKWTEESQQMDPDVECLRSKFKHLRAEDRIKWASVWKVKYQWTGWDIGESWEESQRALEEFDEDRLYEEIRMGLHDDVILVDGEIALNPLSQPEEEEEEKDPNHWEEEEEDYDNKIFKIDPVSGEFSLWKEIAKKPRILSIAGREPRLITGVSLIWDPVRGHH